MSNEDHAHVQFKRKQFPIRLIRTYHYKSQWQSLKNVGIHIDSSLFSHGHFYVSMSHFTNEET
jgi:hypothetical protein